MYRKVNFVNVAEKLASALGNQEDTIDVTSNGLSPMVMSPLESFNSPVVNQQLFKIKAVNSYSSFSQYISSMAVADS